MQSIGYANLISVWLINWDQQISVFAYSSNSGVGVYSLYYHAKVNLELIDRTLRTLIRRRSGRRILDTILTYSIAVSFSFIYLPVSLFLFLLVLLPEFIQDRYFGRDVTFESKLPNK